MRKYRKSETVVIKEYYDYSSFFYFNRKLLIFLRNDRDYNDVDLKKTRKRYVVREILDFTKKYVLASELFL